MDYKVLKNFFPFHNLAELQIERLVLDTSPQTISFKRGELILSCDHLEEKIGFILDGECSVYKEREKEDILLQTLRAYDSFGILTLFSNEEYPTKIIAKKPSTVVFFSKSDFLRLIEAPEISLNVIKFLANKVSFLNKKIATLSGATVEEKIENYLYIQLTSFGIQFPFNAAAVASQINIGRASLYRVLHKMVENGILELENKQITIKNTAYFERSTT